MVTSQRFGGNWTEEKLNMFTDYLNAYATALQNQPFKKVYIDAFAGTGEIETNDGGLYLVGSAKRALAAGKKFDGYFFVEKDEEKAAELQRMVDTEFPHLADFVHIYCGDANVTLEEIIHKLDWRDTRGLLFLDPYATEVNWTTLETVAKTKSIDLWYLFPFAALNRMLPNDGEYESCADCIDRLLGDPGWRTEFYKKDPQLSMFDLLPDGEEFESGARRIKAANLEHIKAYIISRLETIFPCVSRYPRVFKNGRNSPIFLFCFAVANESRAAQKVAMQIADWILTRTR